MVYYGLIWFNMVLWCLVVIHVDLVNQKVAELSTNVDLLLCKWPHIDWNRKFYGEDAFASVSCAVAWKAWFLLSLMQDMHSIPWLLGLTVFCALSLFSWQQQSSTLCSGRVDISQRLDRVFDSKHGCCDFDWLSGCLFEYCDILRPLLWCLSC
jgi:hypothetical protein